MVKQFSPRIYPEWGELIFDLPEDLQNKIFRAILKYPNEDVDCGVWRFIKSQIDKDFEEFSERCRKNGEISKNYWQKRKSIPNDIQTDTERYPNGYRPDTDRIPNDILNININKNVNINEEQEQEQFYKKQKIVFSEFDVEKINSILRQFRLAEIKRLTDDRKRKLINRIDETDSGTLDGFLETVKDALMHSEFLRGERSSWRADFDFFLQKSSWQKVVEGAYADKEEENPFRVKDI